MSDNFLRLIPVDPAFEPTPDVRIAAEKYLRSLLPSADAVESRTSSQVDFVDAGGNFGDISCPTCGTALDQEWWSEAMASAGEMQFCDLTVKTPCCSAATTLNDLHYEMPVGFARFVLEATNPNADSISVNAMTELERLIGRQLRTVWAHY